MNCSRQIFPTEYVVTLENSVRRKNVSKTTLDKSAQRSSSQFFVLFSKQRGKICNSIRRPGCARPPLRQPSRRIHREEFKKSWGHVFWTRKFSLGQLCPRWPFFLPPPLPPASTFAHCKRGCWSFYRGDFYRPRNSKVKSCAHRG